MHVTCGVSCREEIASIVAGILGTNVENEQPLMDAGLDSLGAVDLRNALIARFGLDLPATATFDFPTIAAMAQHIATSMAPSHISEPTWRENEIVAHDFGPPTKAAVQVVGLACIYPGKLLQASPLCAITAPNYPAEHRMLWPLGHAGL